MSGAEQPPARVRVTGPRTSRPRRTTVASEIDAQTELGAVYMRSLMRTQLRLALGALGLLVVTVGALPLLFATLPAARHAELAGIPLPWLLLGFAVYPFMLALAWLYVRRAEHNERSFQDLVEEAPHDRTPRDPGPAPTRPTTRE